MTTLRLIPRNWHYEATLSTEFPAADGYSIVNTQNRKRSRVWRSSSFSGANAHDDQYIAGTFADGFTRGVNFFGLFRHRCHGGKVRLELFSDANWTVQVYDSTALDIINVTPTDGHDWGIDPYGEGRADPHLLDAPYWLYFGEVDCLSYRITFSDHAILTLPNPSDPPPFGAQFWEVGTFVLGRYFEVGWPPAYGAELGFIDLTETDRSRGGSLYSNRGAQARTLKLALDNVAETERAAWVDIVRYSGLGRDVVVSLFPEDGSR
jgi:hypothetical protein